MVKELAERIDMFPGAPNQVRCFAHVINLVAKTVLRQFDTTCKADDKGGKESASGDDTDAESLLAELVSGIDLDNLDLDKDGDVDGEVVDDDVDGWIDERTDLTSEEREELRESVLPVKLVLAKVRRDLFAHL